MQLSSIQAEKHPTGGTVRSIGRRRPTSFFHFLQKSRKQKLRSAHLFAAAATISLVWALRSNINATINAGDTGKQGFFWAPSLLKPLASPDSGAPLATLRSERLYVGKRVAATYPLHVAGLELVRHLLNLKLCTILRAKSGGHQQSADHFCSCFSTVVWQWGDSFPHTLQRKNPTIHLIQDLICCRRIENIWSEY